MRLSLRLSLRVRLRVRLRQVHKALKVDQLGLIIYNRCFLRSERICPH